MNRGNLGPVDNRGRAALQRRVSMQQNDSGLQPLNGVTGEQIIVTYRMSKAQTPHVPGNYLLNASVNARQPASAFAATAG